MDRALLKQKAKQVVRRTVGEPYVGKRLKLRRVSPAIRDLRLDPKRILDAGAEDATFVYWLADRYPFATVTAADIDSAAISACLRARPAAYRSRVDFVVARFAELDPDAFDLITAFDVLEHIDDDGDAARALFRALKPGGTLLVHVPRDQWTDRHGHTERVPDEEAWRINPGHVRMGYGADSLRALLTDAGFEVSDIRLWVRRYGVLAHSIYHKLEHPTVLRIFTVPITDLLSLMDTRRPEVEGNTVWAVARKPIRAEVRQGNST